jgi:hypothetical protein
LAALIRAIDPTLRATEIAGLISSTAEPLESLAATIPGGGRILAPDAVQAARFVDIPGTTFADDIMTISIDGIVRGCAVALFCPDDVVTRGQMAALLTRALGLAAAVGDTFSDDDTSVFQADIEAIVAAGITTGCGDGLFCPDEPVTRGQMAAFLVRGYDLLPSNDDAFEDDNASVFEAQIYALAAASVTDGCGPAQYCPEALVSRGEMAAFLRRVRTVG